MPSDEITTLLQSEGDAEELRRRIDDGLRESASTLEHSEQQIRTAARQETMSVGRTVLSADALIESELSRRCVPLEQCLRQCHQRLESSLSGLLICEQACYDTYSRLCEELSRHIGRGDATTTTAPAVSPLSEPPAIPPAHVKGVPPIAPGSGGVAPVAARGQTALGEWVVESTPNANVDIFGTGLGGLGWFVRWYCDTATGAKKVVWGAVADIVTKTWREPPSPPWQLIHYVSPVTYSDAQRYLATPPFAALPSYCTPQQLPPRPPTPQPTPPTPTQPTPQPCIPICGVTPGTQPPSEETPAEGKCPPWKLYWSQTEQRCYVVVGDGKPHSDADQLIAEGSDYAGLIAAYEQYCGPTQQPAPPQPSPITQPITGPATGVIDCTSVAGMYQYIVGMPGSLSDTAKILLDIVGVGDKPLSAGIGYIDKIVDGIGDSVVKGAIETILSVVVGSIARGLSYLGRVMPCHSDVFLRAQTLDVLLSFFETWVGAGFSKLREPLTQIKNYACPTSPPDISAANTAYVQGLIAEDVWREWVARQNHCPDLWIPVLRGSIDRLTPEQATIAWRRGLLTDSEYEYQLTLAGWQRGDRRQFWDRFTQLIPPVTDILRFLVRDTADPTIVSRFGLDDEFANKWQGDLVVWARQQGITDDVARHYWRAHWSIPSPTQLFEIFHRSRGLPEGHPAKRSVSDIRTALIQQDILPYWIDPILETTYAIMRIADIARAYEVGIFTEDDVRQQLTMRGYRDRDVEALLTFYRRQKQDRLKKHAILNRLARLEVPVAKVQEVLTRAGATPDLIEEALEATYPKIRQAPAVRDAVQGYITIGELSLLLESVGIPPRESQKIIDWVRRRKTAPWRRRCINAIRVRYLTGVIDDVQARNELTTLLRDVDEVDAIMHSLRCEFASHVKSISASTLCTWFEQGLINPDDALRALRRQGYSQDDSFRIMASCAIRLGERQAKDLERLQQRLERERQRQEREAEKRERERQRQEALRAKRAEHLRQIQQRRETKMLTLKQRISEISGQPIEVAHQWVTETYRLLREQAKFHPDDILSLLSVAVTKTSWQTLPELSQHVAELTAESQEFDRLLLTEGETNGQQVAD